MSTPSGFTPVNPKTTELPDIESDSEPMSKQTFEPFGSDEWAEVMNTNVRTGKHEIKHMIDRPAWIPGTAPLTT